MKDVTSDEMIYTYVYIYIYILNTQYHYPSKTFVLIQRINQATKKKIQNII